ncbi:MAG: small multi-drug export protein [Kiritimatiellae bacterium]|nr:small multi-drug export protein [Kiritimatiellia bacterium]
MPVVLIIAELIFFTCIPALELRFSIPMGFFALKTEAGVPLEWWWVALICIGANILLGIGVYEVLLPILRLMCRFKWFAEKLWKHVEHRREKLQPIVEKYGEWGLALFIGVPLPGTGAVTGAAGAFLLGFSRPRFYLANAVGVLIAGICVTVLCLLIQQGVVADDSLLRTLFIKDVH